MYTGIYRENQWGESHHSSRGFRPSNHFGQFDRLDLSDGVDKARFEVITRPLHENRGCDRMSIRT